MVLGILLIWWLSLKTDLSMESLVGVVFVLSMTVGFSDNTRRRIIACSFWKYFCRRLSDAVAAVFVSIIVFIAARMIYSKMMLAYVSEDLALAGGVKINKYNLIYLFLIARRGGFRNQGRRDSFDQAP